MLKHVEYIRTFRSHGRSKQLTSCLLCQYLADGGSIFIETPYCLVLAGKAGWHCYGARDKLPTSRKKLLTLYYNAGTERYIDSDPSLQ
jgi:hypothetical protein